MHRLIHHDPMLIEGTQDPVSEYSEIENILNKMEQLAIDVTNHDEEDHKVINLVEAPNYCSYFHLQFWGRDLPVELTLAENGFIMRCKYEQVLEDIKEDLEFIMGEGVKILNRQGIDVL